MQPIRICQLITELNPGGAERCVCHLATRLDRRRFTVEVAALRGGALAEELVNAGVRVNVLGVRGKWDIFKLAKLSRLLRRERIDLLHTHLFHADLAGRLAMRWGRVPHLVHTVHVAEGRFRPWQFAFARRMRKRCSRIIAVSKSVADWHSERSGLPRDNYTVIPNGIDTDYWQPSETSRSRLRQQWGVGEGDSLAAFVGRLDPQKGVDVLLAAADGLAGRKGVKLVLAGDGPMKPAVEKYCQGNDAVRYLGFVDDIRGVLSAADVFVLPSRWEGWPLALGEAMSMGLAVVGTDVPGIRDVIRDNQTGLLVAGEDPSALAEAVNRLVGDAALRARLGAAGRNDIQRRFSLGVYVSAHEALYEGVMADVRR